MEMKYARDLPKQNIDFLDLPTELCVRIYKYAFRFEDPIEFLHETNTMSQDSKLRRKNARKLGHPIKSRKLNLGFLRTCRTVHAEGSQIFYGDNDFRFSSINGHLQANLFMRKIYKQHYQWLKRLNIPMPFYSNGKDSSRCNTNPFSHRTLALAYGQTPFSSWSETEPEYEEAFEDLTERLLRAERFEKLTLVLPEYYGKDYVHEASMGKILKQFVDARVKQRLTGRLPEIADGKTALHIEVVRLCNFDNLIIDQFEQPDDDAQSEHSTSFEDGEGQLWRFAGIPTGHCHVLRLIKNLASEHIKVSVRGAYIADNGLWKVIEGLEEVDVCHPDLLL